MIMISSRNTMLNVAQVLAIVALFMGGAVAAQSRTGKSPKLEARMHKMTEGDFASLMEKHHQAAIEMATLEESKGANSALKALATKMRQDQTREIAELKTWTKRHPATPSADAAGHEKTMAKEQAAAMAKLKGAAGATLDHMFAMEMTKHHQMAIKMVDDTQFKDPDLKKMADMMKAAQSAEIKQLAPHATMR